MKKFLIIILGFSLAIGIGIYLGMGYKESAIAKSTPDTTNIPVEKLDEHTVNLEELTVKLADDKYGKVAFNFLVSTKKGAEELTKRDFQIKSYVLKCLSSITSTTLQDGTASQAILEELKIYMNKHMQEGEILEVYFSNKLIA